MIDEKTLEYLVQNFDKIEKLIYILIAVLVLNILSVLFKFFLDYRLKEREKNIYRKNLIANNTISVQEKLYLLLDELTLFDGNEQAELLQKISEIEKFITKNKLYLEKEILKITYKYLDYFKSVLTDFRKKDYKKEMEILEQYVKKFNK